MRSTVDAAAALADSPALPKVVRALIRALLAAVAAQQEEIDRLTARCDACADQPGQDRQDEQAQDAWEER